MEYKGLIEAALIGGVLLVVLNLPYGRLSAIISDTATPQVVATPQERVEVPHAKTFRTSDGREATIAFPVLGGFTYPGDAEFCRFANGYNKVFGRTPNAMDDCGAFAALEPLPKAYELLLAAQDTAMLAITAASGEQSEATLPVPSEPPAGKAMALAISALHEAVNLLPEDAVPYAQKAFGTYLGDLKTVDHSYHPDFLFVDAFRAEFGRANITLCQLMKEGDCLARSSSNLAEALMSAGRWKSDVDSLVLSADVAEAIYKSRRLSDAGDELDFADQFASSLGYAHEMATGAAGLVYGRRGVMPLEKWYREHKNTYGDNRAVAMAAHTLGSSYGRIAFKTRAANDLARTLEYDGDAYRMEQERKGHPSWTIMSNYGDTFVLKGEIEGNAQDVIKGLDMQRQALAKTLAEEGPEDQAYAMMKVAQTLVRYARLPDADMAHDKKLEILNEGKQLALEAEMFFKSVNAPAYIRFVGRILEGIKEDLAALASPSRSTTNL